MVSENDSALLKEIAVEIVDLLFNKNSNSLVSNENVFSMKLKPQSITISNHQLKTKSFLIVKTN